MTDPFVVEIEVLDSVGRRRMLAVRGGDAGVVLVPPPGGGFTVPPSHVEQLRKALADARAHTLRAGWGDQ